MMKTWLSIAVVALGSTLFACGGAAPTPPAAPDTASAAGAGGDADGDGVPDAMDKCADKKEDGQAPDPKDGCPKG